MSVSMPRLLSSSPRAPISRVKGPSGRVYAPMALSRHAPADNRSRVSVGVAGASVAVTRKVTVGALSTPALAAGVIGAAVGAVGALVVGLPTLFIAGGAIGGAVGGMWLAAHATETQQQYAEN